MTTPSLDNAVKRATSEERVAVAIGEAIRELGSVPSGFLYARLMSLLSLDQYQAAIDVLVAAKLVTNSGHLLTWKGNA